MSLGKFLSRHGLLLATRNQHKLREFRRLLEERSIRVFESPADAPEVAETADSFAGNAELKARALGAYLARAELPPGYSRALPVLADDSGIAVDVLDGGPGVYSARYGGDGLDDAGRVALMLRELAGVPEAERTARYVCVLALYAGHLPDRPFPEEVLTFRGVCEGRIAFEPAGSEGFGYDPVFFDPELGRTFAQIPPAVKDARSHRGRALEAFLEALSS